MFPYLFLFAFATYLYINKNTSNIAIGVFSFFMIFICGFRDMIGGFDVYIYAEIFEKINNGSFTEYFEKGFIWYYKMLHFIGSSRELMFFVTALLMIGMHTLTISKWSNHKGMSTFIYFCKFFLFTFVYLRQGLAMGLVWLSISFLLNEKKPIALALLFVAFLFHKTAFVFIVLFFITNYKIKIYQFILLISLAILIALTPLGTFITAYFTDNIIDDKYQVYVSKFSVVNILYAIEAVLLIFLILKFRLSFYQTSKGTLVYNGILVYTFFIVLSLTNATFVRFSWYFLLFYCIGLVYIYDFITLPKWKLTFRLIVFIYFSLLFFRLLFFYDGGDFIPYKSIFEDFDREGMWDHLEYK